MAAPDLAAARCAADELVAAGVTRVLLFGSLARNEAFGASDIDLVAIYDDLGDYGDRLKRRCALENRAETAAGWPVDVFVTDAAEWAVRSTRVPCSLEASIASYAVELADTDRRSDIDWDKEIGLPSDPAGELQYRFADMSDAVEALELQARVSPVEDEAVLDGDHAALSQAEDARFARAMGAAHMAMESAAKTLHIAFVGTTPVYSHSIAKLLGPQPEWVRNAFAALAGASVDLGDIHIWRQGATYSADRPVARFDADTLRAHARAALAVAGFAADHCRHRGISDEHLRVWDRRRTRCERVLDGPIRHRDSGQDDTASN